MSWRNRGTNHDEDRRAAAEMVVETAQMETVNAGEMTKERNLSRHWLSMLPSDATLHEMYVSIASTP